MSHRQLLSRATEGTEAPTPGYIYVDLAKTAMGNPGACQEMATYLTRRLAAKQNPNIKFKCLKVIAKLCDQVPRNAFRRCVAQDHEGIGAIKDAMNYRGTPDPVRGDEPNQKVRIAAKEALDAVYREAPSSEAADYNHSSAAGPAAYANYANPNQYAQPSPYGGPAGSSSSMGTGSSRMQGIGNPRYSDPRLDPRYNGEQPISGVQAVLRETGEVIVGMIKDPLARNIGPPAAQAVPRQGYSGNLPGYGAPQYGRPPPGQAELSRNTGGEWTMASNRGPGAVQSDYGRDAHAPQYGGAPPHGGGHSASSGTVGGSWGSTANGGISSSSSVIRPSQQQYASPMVNIQGGGTAASDGVYEKNLVKELCPPGGTKPVPPPDKLASFARVCASLNSDLVCPALLDALEDGQPWIIRAKALCAMETAIANGTKLDGQNPYRDFFYACRDEIAPLTSHPRAPIHEPARRVLTLLGVEGAAVAAAAPSAAAAPVVAAPNLLDFDEPTPPPASQVAATPVAPPPPAAAATVVPTNTGASMFGGMQVKSTTATPTTTPAAPVTTAAAAAAPVAPEPSLLDDWGAPPAPAGSSEPAMAATTSMFGQLSVKTPGTDSANVATASLTEAVATNATTNNNMNNDPLASPTPAGSAFGFINNNSAASPGANGLPSQPPTFDPLKQEHFSPTTANKKAMSMQMSPEQMQAMAYQQMMMQQQMQQMQMAMAMQAGVVGGMPRFPNIVGTHPMPSGSGMPSAQQFSFNAKPAQKDDKKFDFVMDAMKTAGHKK